MKTTKSSYDSCVVEDVAGECVTIDISSIAKIGYGGEITISLPVQPLVLEFPIFTSEFYDKCRELKLGDSTIEEMYEAIKHIALRAQVIAYIAERV